MKTIEVDNFETKQHIQWQLIKGRIAHSDPFQDPI